MDATLTDPGTLWLLAALVLLGLAVLAFGFAVVRGRRDVLAGWFEGLDRWLARRVPRFWRFVRERFSRESWHGIGLTLGALVMLGGIWAFAEITDEMRDEDLYTLDQSVHAATEDALTPGWISFLRVLTRFGDVIVVLGVGLGVLGLLWWKKQRWKLLALLLSVGGGQALLWSLKAIYGRARPGDGLVDTVGHSFPSGHSFGAATLYGFLIFLVWTSHARQRTKVGGSLALVLLIFGIGLSRVLLGVHWVSDVLGGWILGLAWVAFSLIAARAAVTWQRE